MTDLNDLYSNDVGQCIETCVSVPSVDLMSICTIEDLLAKYLIDFVIEEENVLGYINDLNTFREILEKMKDLGFAFSVRDSDARQKQREKIKKCAINGKQNEKDGGKDLFSHLTVFYQLKAMPIKFFGLPFTIDKTTHYQCAYGCKYYKSRASATKVKSDDKDLLQVKKKKKIGSKKMGCLAKMTLKHITVYPDYKLDVETDWRKKKKLIENLRKDLSDDCKIVSQFQRFYLSVSLQSSHNHPPIIIKPKLKIQKQKSHRIHHKGVKLLRGEETELEEPQPMNPTIIAHNDWNYIGLASSSLNLENETKDEIPVKALSLKDDGFFHTHVKFPNSTPAIFEEVDYKPNEIAIEIKSFEAAENTSTIEVYEYQPTLQDLQTLFKEKLKNLYTLCGSCTNGALILRLAGDLEQVELQLSNDVNFSNL